MEVAETVTLREPKRSFISKPLFKQSLKANWMLWLILTLAAAGIFVIINLVVGTKQVFTNIDMTKVAQYVKDQDLSWLEILGLLENMGFNLSRIQVMSQIDMNSILNDLIYRIAGVLLPMIFVMITANRLVAMQVNDGSMAYVLATPTNRHKVTRTQMLFLLASLTAMYVVIFVAAYSTDMIADAILKAQGNVTQWVPLRVPLFTLGSYAAIFALAGICFGASCWYNKSASSVALGGGICILSYLSCVLGLFGNKIFVSVGIGVEAMNIFNYLTVFSLIDTDSMSQFAKAVGGLDVPMSFDWIWKTGILLAIGAVCAFIGTRKFARKDLPL